MKVKLKYWRQRRAMSIDDLAEKSGTSTQTIVNAEKHGKTPRPRTLRKWAEALQISLDELIEVSEEENDQINNPDSARSSFTLHRATLL